LNRRVDGYVDAGSVLVGHVVVEAGARVLRSRIEGPAIIGAGTVVQDSWVGPHTSIGRDCLVADSRLENSIALDGASVTGQSGLRDALLGFGQGLAETAAGQRPGRVA
jgi:glucose-1-phosphate thymidylyltransferase